MLFQCVPCEHEGVLDQFPVVFILMLSRIQFYVRAAFARTKQNKNKIPPDANWPRLLQYLQSNYFYLELIINYCSFVGFV